MGVIVAIIVGLLLFLGGIIGAAITKIFVISYLAIPGVILLFSAPIFEKEED